MSGSKYGFETKLRENAAPAPIDIYGDSCHHIHDACKKFTKIFNQYLKSSTKIFIMTLSGPKICELNCKIFVNV